MTLDDVFVQSARRRIAIVDQQIQAARSHAHWHPQNEWQAFTGEPVARAAEPMRIGAAIRRIIERCTRSF